LPSQEADIRRFANPLSYPVLHFAHPVLQRGFTSAHPATLNSLAICPETRLSQLAGEVALLITLEEQILIGGKVHSNSGRTGMSIFGSIMSAIFSHSSSQAPAAPAAAIDAVATPAAQSAPAAAPAGAPVDAAPATATDTDAAAIPTAQAAPAAAPAGAPVDVAAIMDNLASQATEKLDWCNSIVDLMKLINLDSSLTARKELAQELDYTGDMNDSASMNIWLHKEVMTKLAENGGTVPDELKH
jgi:uncharacterized protein DUF3597